MLKRMCLGGLVASAIASSAWADSDQAFKTGGTWVRLYMNDFKGMIYQGVSKQQNCNSAARVMAGKFMKDGRKVVSHLLTDELAVFEVSGDRRIMIYCNANGVLFADMMMTSDAANTMADAAMLGSEQTREDNRTVVKSRTDPRTGETTTEKTEPTKPDPLKTPQQ